MISRYLLTYRRLVEDAGWPLSTGPVQRARCAYAPLSSRTRRPLGGACTGPMLRPYPQVLGVISKDAGICFRLAWRISYPIALSPCDCDRCPMHKRSALGVALLLLITGCSSGAASSSPSSSSAATGFRLDVVVRSPPSRIHAKDVYLNEPNGQKPKVGHVVRIDANQSTQSTIHIALTRAPRVPRDVYVSVCNNRIELRSRTTLGPYIFDYVIVPSSRSEVIDGPC